MSVCSKSFCQAPGECQPALMLGKLLKVSGGSCQFQGPFQRLRGCLAQSRLLDLDTTLGQGHLLGWGILGSVGC